MAAIALELGSYEHVGRHLAWFLLHGGPGELAIAALTLLRMWRPRMVPSHPSRDGVRRLCVFALRLARSVD